MAASVPTIDRYGSAAADLVRCAACGHAQLAELPLDQTLESAYRDAEDWAYVEEEAGQRMTAARALDLIERYAPVGELCDLGCWVGFLLSEAELRGWRVRGVEPSRFASRYARERLGLDVVTATLLDAPLPERAFQAVVLADVIEHLPRPDEALERAGRLLLPGGIVYLALPDAGSLVARGLGARWWSVLPTHLHYFTRRSIAILLARHGFEVSRLGTAPKSFTVRYYLGRLGGYSRPLAAAAVRTADVLGMGSRVVTPNFRDRMAVVARYRR